jgi:hypothetical protein
MPLPDLTDEERAELVRLIRDAIDGDRYFMSPASGGSRAFWPRSILRPSSMSVHRTRHRSHPASRAFSIAS